MIEISDVVVRGAESVHLTDDKLGFVVEISLYPSSSAINPDLSEEFFEHVGAIDLEFESFTLSRATRPALGTVQGVLPPNESRLVH